jgi:murein DD-endopeptidase MepM/ murein hydrolase activator NlpD
MKFWGTTESSSASRTERGLCDSLDDERARASTLLLAAKPAVCRDSLEGPLAYAAPCAGASCPPYSTFVQLTRRSRGEDARAGHLRPNRAITTGMLRSTFRAAILVAAVVLPSVVLPASSSAAQSDFVWPATGFISQNAAQHKASFENQYAEDIANGGSGVPVVAAYDGIVQTSTIDAPGDTCTVDGHPYPSGYGNVVVLRHDGGATMYWTMYGHLASRSVNAGDHVTQGAQIGVMGSTGCSSGQHVHFEVGTCINESGLVTPACSVWGKAPSDPAPGATVAQGTPTGGTYGGLALPPWHYIGQIVQWDGDTNDPRASWLVGQDLRRRWLPDGRTYTCLRGRLVPDAGALAASVLSDLPDATGVWAQCPPGDVNHSGKVDIYDLSALLSSYGRTGLLNADATYDGKVDIFDLSVLLSSYGRSL